MTAPVVQGLFERRAKGMSWVKLALWATEQGCEMTDKGVEYLIRNRAYLGIAHYGEIEKKDAHPALVAKGVFAKCQIRGRRHSSRDGYLTNRFMLCGIGTCAGCSSYLRLSSGGRNRNPFYICRNLHCAEKAYAQAGALDAYVINVLFGYDEEDHSVPGLIDVFDQTVSINVGDPLRIEEAEFEVESVQAALDAFLADTKLITILGEAKYNDTVSDYVTVVNNARNELEQARESEDKIVSLGKLWVSWNIQERHEWLEKMIKRCAVSKGREPLSERTDVSL
jgi:hypothetical protein